MATKKFTLHPDRYLDANPSVRKIARELYRSVKKLPIISPHGHVDPALFSKNKPFPDPAQLFIVPDHYIFRMLHAQGIPLERMGVPTRDGSPTETDGRKIWQLFAENYHLFRGTPSGAWLDAELVEVLGVKEKLNGKNAQKIYDFIQAKLETKEFRPRALFQRFNIEVLATTDAATDTLDHHTAMRASGWKGRVIPTFRPDGVTNLLDPAWSANVKRLGELAGHEITTMRAFIGALESRRAFFKSMGAVATDHGVQSPYTHQLSEREADDILGRALKGLATAQDAAQFTAHMLLEMARMSSDDGLVMQLHAGALRNHHTGIFRRFGPDKGFDIPAPTEYVSNLRELTEKYGNHPNLKIILFTLDETTYARELAPLVGVYPALKVGPAWWFHDSIEGMVRYRANIMETAGLYNTAGFNDDTRAFLSIPARHDLSRRMDANWVASLVARHLVSKSEGSDMMYELANGLVKRAYGL